MLDWALALGGGYSLGTLPWGWMAGKVLKGVDVRQFGSGRLGATNVLRTVGVKAGVGVFLADVGKGAAAAALGWLLLGTDLGAAAAALAAVAGHNWPLYLRLRGGRGVSPFLGGLAVLSLPTALIVGAVAVGFIALYRYVSLGSIMAALSAAALSGVGWAVGWLGGWVVFGYAAIGGGFVLLQHRDNLSRLRHGRERKLGQPADPVGRA